uniref:Uncharacterized protein n=1 Tax=Cacopsylla melanoneura TaxID=428564 RepID=A0A8D8UWK4_9HEMI
MTPLVVCPLRRDSWTPALHLDYSRLRAKRHSKLVDISGVVVYSLRFHPCLLLTTEDISYSSGSLLGFTHASSIASTMRRSPSLLSRMFGAKPPSSHTELIFWTKLIFFHTNQA